MDTNKVNTFDDILTVMKHHTGKRVWVKKVTLGRRMHRPDHQSIGRACDKWYLL